ncbi:MULTISPECIES: hypothetical protein [unclassified Escherichia]|uniref:hypothetical protein n=1 Tax=unclassified Escherichia TaxID=2608889 RepID=UPI0013EED26C|nr:MULTISPECIES: hypothetical protein [unclassified Escherichia]
MLLAIVGDGTIHADLCHYPLIGMNALRMWVSLALPADYLSRSQSNNLVNQHAHWVTKMLTQCAISFSAAQIRFL